MKHLSNGSHFKFNGKFSINFQNHKIIFFGSKSLLFYVCVCDKIGISSVNILKFRVSASNYYMLGSRRGRLCAVYSILILQRIGMGKEMIVNDVAFHAIHSLRKSSRVFDVDSPYPNVADTVKIVIRPPPVIEKIKIFASIFMHLSTSMNGLKIKLTCWMVCLENTIK